MSDTVRNMMQEKLDGNLDNQMADALFEMLQQDETLAIEQERLERLHDMLTRAPQVRAPSHLAATIMARLAQVLEDQPELSQVPEAAREALMLSISLISLSFMPMMGVAGQALMQALEKGETSTRDMQQTIALMALLVQAQITLLDEIEIQMRDKPEDAIISLALLPTAIETVVKVIEEAHLENSGNGKE